MTPPEIYANQMTELKIRLLSAERVINSPTPLTGFSSLDCEFCMLQVRKMVELITFAGMVREEARYRKLREGERKRETDRIDPTADWNATEILSRLVKLSPHALPIPLGDYQQTEEGVVNYEGKKLKGKKLIVNHAKLIELYKDCSAFVHVPNPLVNDFGVLVELQRKKYVSAPATVKKALAFLREMLWRHAVVQLEWTVTNDPTVPDNPSTAWLVDFEGPDDQSISVTLATTSDTDPVY